MNRLSFRWLVPRYLRERYALKLGVSLVVLVIILAVFRIEAGLVGTLTTTLFGVALVTLIWYSLGKDTADEIDRLSEKASRLEAGDYDVEFSTDRIDSIGRLYDCFATMATALEERERSLQAERDRLAALFENSTDSIVHVELDETRIQDVNSQFEACFGYDREAILGESLLDLIVPPECAAESAAMLEQARRGEQFTRELRRGTAAGTREFLFRFVPIRNGEGERVTEGYGVYTDITERRQAQRELEANNRGLRRLHEITTDQDGTFERTVERLLELGCEQFDLGVGILSAIEDDRYEVVATVDSTAEVNTGDCFDLPETICEITVGSDTADVVTLPDIGASEYREHPAYQYGFPAAYIGTPVVVDGEIYGTVNFSSRTAREEAFTQNECELVKLIAGWIGAELERKQREAELELAETLFENTQEVLFVIDVADEGDGAFRVERVNPAYETSTGLTNEEIQGERLEAVVSEANAATINGYYQECLTRREPIEYVEELSLPEPGTYWETRIAPVIIDGAVEQIVGATRNVTEHKARQEELELAETLFENTQDALFVNSVDVDDDRFVIERMNPAFEAQTGLTDADIRDRDLRELFGEEEGGAMVENNRACLARREPIEYEEEVTVPGAGKYWETRMAPVVVDDEVRRIVGATRNVTERKEREQELQRQRRLLEQTQRLANVGGWELDLTSGPPYESQLTDELKRLHEVPLDEAFHLEKGIDFFHPDDRPAVREGVERAMAGEPFALEARLVTAGGRERWVQVTGKPVREDGEIVALYGATQDITERKQYELALESLHEATRELLHTDSTDAICAVVVDIAAEIVDHPGISLCLLDTDASGFVPAAFTPGFVDLCGGTPTLPLGDRDSPAWSAFVTDDTVLVDDPAAIQWAGTDQEHESAAGITSGLFVPVGDHGIVTVLATEGVIDDRTRQLVETLVATTEAAFDRLENEAHIRERDRQLQAHNERLTRQIRITDIIRQVDGALIDATTTEEIETAVCERLVDSDVLSFAWIGAQGADYAIVPRTWAGEGHRYLDSVSLTGSEPARRTAETDSPTVVESVFDRLRTEDWRRDALEHDFQSVISVPINHEEYTYGTLTAYAPDANAFGELESSVFVELGETVGNAINTVQTKQALYGGGVTELKLRFSEEESLVLKLATEADCRVELDGLAADTGEATRLFVHVSGADPEKVLAILDRLVAVTACRAITTTADGGHFEVTVSEGLIASVLVPQGVSPRSLVAENGHLDVVVDVPRETDVREFVELLQDRYPSTELLARRNVERSLGTKAELTASLLSSLSDRQREVLTTAYYSGFFEWPRESTGQDIAAMLGVSQPTVNRHLRLGQRALLGQLFDSDHAPTLTA